jgi:hypothetical protein
MGACDEFIFFAHYVLSLSCVERSRKCQYTYANINGRRQMARNGIFHWYIMAETWYCLRATGAGLRDNVPSCIKLISCFACVLSVGLFMSRPVSELVQRTATRSPCVCGEYGDGSTNNRNCKCWLN